MKWLLWTAFGIILLASAAMLFAGKASGGTTSHLHKYNAGDVHPYQDIVWNVPVRNDSRKLLKLSGFDQACGVSVHLAGNNILPPGAVETMTLRTFAVGQRGPCAQRFVLKKTVGGISGDEDYEIDYNVLPSPYLDMLECRSKRGETTEIKVPFSSMTSPVKVVSAPSGVTAEGNVQSVMVRLDKVGPEGPLGEVKLQVTDENGRIVPFSLPVFAEVTQSTLRTYPASTVATETGGRLTATLKIINAHDLSKVIVSCSNPSVSISRSGEELTLSSPQGLNAGLVRISVAEPNSKPTEADVLF